MSDIIGAGKKQGLTKRKSRRWDRTGQNPKRGAEERVSGETMYERKSNKRQLMNIKKEVKDKKKDQRQGRLSDNRGFEKDIGPRGETEGQ